MKTEHKTEVSKSWFWLTFLAVMLVFVAVNIYDYVRAIPPCCDWAIRFGIPVALGTRGGFVGGTRFYADRLVVIPLLASAVAMFLGLVVERIVLRSRGRKDES